MFHVTPPSVETYTVDVGLVTYIVVPEVEAAVDENTAVLVVNTEVHVIAYVGLSVGTGVGRPSK